MPYLFINREGRLFDDEYFDALANLNTSNLPKHFFFGHPYIVQDDVLKECVQGSMGIEFNNANKDQWKAQGKLIKSLTPNWQFLFQIDSDDSLEVLWGDMGILYVCIPKDSLQKQQFEDCWVVMQFY